MRSKACQFNRFSDIETRSCYSCLVLYHYAKMEHFIENPNYSKFRPLIYSKLSRIQNTSVSATPQCVNFLEL